MLVAAELVVAVVIVRIWSGRPLSRASWAAALAIVTAIAVFLAVTSPVRSRARGRPAGPSWRRPGRRRHRVLRAGGRRRGLRAAGRSRAVLLAVAAGLADSCSAVVTLAFSHAASHGLVALFTSWTVYALVVCGVGNVLRHRPPTRRACPWLRCRSSPRSPRCPAWPLASGCSARHPRPAWQAQSSPASPVPRHQPRARLARPPGPPPRVDGSRQAADRARDLAVAGCSGS